MAATIIGETGSLIAGDIPGCQNELKLMLYESLVIVAQNLFAAERMFTFPPTTRALV